MVGSAEETQQAAVSQVLQPVAMALPGAATVEATAEAPEVGRVCPRCLGRMQAKDKDGDRSCFTCGHVVYGTLPPADAGISRRGGSHAGWRLM